MDIPISPENEAFVTNAVNDGHYRDSQALINEALHLLKRRDDLFRDVDDGVQQLDSGLRVDGAELLDRLKSKYGLA